MLPRLLLVALFIGLIHHSSCKHGKDRHNMHECMCPDISHTMCLSCSEIEGAQVLQGLGAGHYKFVSRARHGELLFAQRRSVTPEDLPYIHKYFSKSYTPENHNPPKSFRKEWDFFLSHPLRCDDSVVRLLGYCENSDNFTMGVVDAVEFYVATFEDSLTALSKVAPLMQWSWYFKFMLDLLQFLNSCEEKGVVPKCNIVRKWYEFGLVERPSGLHIAISDIMKLQGLEGSEMKQFANNLATQSWRDIIPAWYEIWPEVSMEPAMSLFAKLCSAAPLACSDGRAMLYRIMYELQLRTFLKFVNGLALNGTASRARVHHIFQQVEVIFDESLEEPIDLAGWGTQRTLVKMERLFKEHRGSHFMTLSEESFRHAIEKLHAKTGYRSMKRGKREEIE